MKTERKWSVEYSESGGYDCMTGAWTIKSGSQRIHIDCGDFGQKTCDWESDHAKDCINKAKGFARFVMHALNAYEERQKE